MKFAIVFSIKSSPLCTVLTTDVVKSDTHVWYLAEAEDFVVVMIDTEQHGGHFGSQRLELF